MQLPSLAFIGGDRCAKNLFRIKSRPRRQGFQCVHHWQRPLAVREHRRLVHPEAEGTVKSDAELRAPNRRRSIGIVTDACIDPVLDAVLDTAIEEIPEPPFRVDPKAGVVAPCAIAQRQTHGLRRGEGLTTVVAMREHDRVLRLGLFGSSGKPRDKHASLRRAFKAGNTLPGAFAEVDGDRFSGLECGKGEDEAW